MLIRCTHPFYYNTVFDEGYRAFYVYYVWRRGRYVFAGYVPAGYDRIYRGTRVSTVGIMDAINRLPSVMVAGGLVGVLPKTLGDAMDGGRLYAVMKNLRMVK